MSKIREKESLECVRMHIWASKTQKLPGPLSGPWTPATECSLRSRDSALLCWQLSASEAGAPPWPNPGSAPVTVRTWQEILCVFSVVMCERNLREDKWLGIPVFLLTRYSSWFFRDYCRNGLYFNKLSFHVTRLFLTSAQHKRKNHIPKLAVITVSVQSN